MWKFLVCLLCLSVGVVIGSYSDGVLFGQSIEPPDWVPCGIELRRGGLFVLLHPDAAAVSTEKTIILAPNAKLTPEIVCHELKHMEQKRTILHFWIKYWLEHSENGYEKNKYEIEARQAEKECDLLQPRPPNGSFNGATLGSTSEESSPAPCPAVATKASSGTGR